MAYLILPGRRARQPQTVVRPSSYWLSRGLAFLYNGATFVDHVYAIPSTNSGGVGRRVNPSGGIAADISGTQYLAWASRDALNITGALSIIWKGRFDGTTGAYRTVVSKAQSNGATNAPFESYVDTTSGKLAFIRANGTGNRYFQCDTTVVPANTDLTLFINAPETIERTPTIYINATAQTLSGSGTVTGSATESTTDLRIGRRVDNGTQFDGGVELVALFNSQISTDDYLRFIRDPWGEAFAPDPRRLYFGVSGGAGAVTGTSSTTLDAVTGTAAATLAIAATSAATVNAATGTATATLSIAATSSATVGSVTGTAAASLAVAGTSTQSLAAVTGTATGSVVSGAAGTSAATLDATTGTAAGTLALAANSGATVYVVTGTSAGTIAIGAASAQTLSDVTGTALGNTTGATNGTSAATVGTTTGTAAGYVAVLAASSATLAALSGTAAAQIIVAGSSVGQLGGVTGPEPTGVMGPTGGRRYALRGGAASRPRQANTTRPAAR